MRQLRPQVVTERKKKLLQWVVHRYIRTSIPVASQSISEDGGFDLSSASLRNILKELEEEGYLHQPHTSAGRVPTDKGYRFFVDYLTDIQRLAAQEKERIEGRYRKRTEELDELLSETSKLLSHASRSAGLVLSPKMDKQSLRRLELIPIGGQQVLAVLVTQAGQIRHWPIKLSTTPAPSQINRLNRFLNDHIQSRSLREVRESVQARISAAEQDLRELGELARKILDEVPFVDQTSELYVEGATHILAHPEELGDVREIQSIIRMLEGKKALAELLEREMESELQKPRELPGSKSLVHVRIGRENPLSALRNVSLVTATYRHGGQVVGVLGIMGSKRMEYSRMMGLVDVVSDIVSRTLESWGTEDLNR